MPLLRVILMSRAPVAGRTKTRLIPVLGEAGAAAFHAACLSDLLAVTGSWKRAADGTPVRLTLSVTPAGSEADFLAAGIVPPKGAGFAVQRGDSLEERMRAALRDAMADAERALLIGADLPLLTRRHLEHAARALLDHDAVLGPAEDGGYYLVGVRKAEPGAWEGLFEAGHEPGAIPAEDTVLERALARASGLGLRVAGLDPLPDVDTPEDARRVLSHPLSRRLRRRRSVTMLRERLGGSHFQS